MNNNALDIKSSHRSFFNTESKMRLICKTIRTELPGHSQILFKTKSKVKNKAVYFTHWRYTRKSSTFLICGRKIVDVCYICAKICVDKFSSKLGSFDIGTASIMIDAFYIIAFSNKQIQNAHTQKNAFGLRHTHVMFLYLIFEISSDKMRFGVALTLLNSFERFSFNFEVHSNIHKRFLALLRELLKKGLIKNVICSVRRVCACWGRHE